MSQNKSFCVNWVAGPSAQIELFCPGDLTRRRYEMKYTPPFRSTIRPPSYKLPASGKSIRKIRQRINELVENLKGRSSPQSLGADQPKISDEDKLNRVRLLGNMLYTFLVRKYVQADLFTEGLFVEIGLDEELLNYPWELMHDGTDFLCLKHYIGRYIISSQPVLQNQRAPSTSVGDSLDKLSVLIISVPNPQDRILSQNERIQYDNLPEAKNETEAIITALTGIDGVEIETLIQDQATYDQVYTKLSDNQYDIIHYNGHARFDDDNPYRSGLVLFDDDFETNELETTIGQKSPVLCFINGCETAKEMDSPEKASLDVYSLARAFLETGSYLLGSRWNIEDKTAKIFAMEFYKALIRNEKSIGEAIAFARKATKDANPTDPYGWASYIYYGDPRICFRKL